MDSEEKILSLLEKMYIDFNKRFESIEANIATKQELDSVKVEVRSVKETVIRIENDHGQKLGALFDGHKINSEKLNRIEAEVSKHEEVILRRIR